VVEYPTTPLSFEAALAGWKELRTLIDGQEIAAGLLGGKVFAFGHRERIQTVFEKTLKGAVEPGSIQGDDFRHPDSVMLGLLYDIITTSLVTDYGLVRAGRRDHRLFYVPVDLPLTTDHTFSFDYRKQTYSIPLAVKKSGVVFNEAFSFQLDYEEDALWFVLQPRVVVTANGRELAPVEKRRLANAELSSRYNKTSHDRLLFWLSYLTKVATPITFSFPSKAFPACRMVLDIHYAYSFLEAQ